VSRPEGRRQRQRGRHQPGVLGGEEGTHKIRRGIGQHGHPLPTPEAGTEHPPRQIQGVLPQLAIRKAGDMAAPDGMESQPGGPARGVIQSLRQHLEITPAQRKAAQGRDRKRHLE